jgi:hypothetical protein
MDKLSIKNEMYQLDTKNRNFVDELSEAERKKFSTYIMLKYCANVDGGPDLQEWYLRATNERVNINFFDLGKHEKLQWLLCTTVSQIWAVNAIIGNQVRKKKAIIKFTSYLLPNIQK